MHLKVQTWRELKQHDDDLNAKKGTFNTLKVSLMGPQQNKRTQLLIQRKDISFDRTVCVRDHGGPKEVSSFFYR